MADGNATDHGSVCVLGAGTMGAGIAQVAATAGWTVVLMDVEEAIARGAIEGVHRRLDRLVEKGVISAAARDAAAGHLRVASGPDDLASCTLVIEAIVEDLDAKAGALRKLLPSLPDDVIVATNTSSLSVTRIGEAIGRPARTVGMHFFNPAPLLALVEVVAGRATDAEVVDRAAQIATSWGKRVARAADQPGFIVNHVARPYYLEALRIMEDGLAGPEEIDETMRRLGGFRMGPLELTDLIGQDVNAATTRSVWTQLGRPPLLHPSRLQEDLVARGHLGRKTGVGVYRYDASAPASPGSPQAPRSALEIARRPLDLVPALADVVDRFAAAAAAGAEPASPLGRYVLARILVALVAQAALAHERGVASPEDIDTALRYGTNYPAGPFEWAERIGPALCAELLESLDATVDDHRFAVPRTLRSGALRR